MRIFRGVLFPALAALSGMLVTSAQGALVLQMVPGTQGIQANTPNGLVASAPSTGGSGFFADSSGLAGVILSGFGTNTQSYMYFTGSISGTALGGTTNAPSPSGSTSLSPTYTPVTLQVVGTAGETGPVTLTLSDFFQYTPGGSSSSTAAVQVNGTTVFSANSAGAGPATFQFTTNVGGTFTLSELVTTINSSGAEAFGTLTTTLTATQIAAPVPEPATLAMGLMGVPVLSLWALKRRRKTVA